MALEEDRKTGGIPVFCSSSRWLLWQRKIAPFDGVTVLRTARRERGDLPKPESAQDAKRRTRQPAFAGIGAQKILLAALARRLFTY